MLVDAGLEAMPPLHGPVRAGAVAAQTQVDATELASGAHAAALQRPYTFLDSKSFHEHSPRGCDLCDRYWH